MERRFKLGREIAIATPQERPTLKFSPDGKKMIITFAIDSTSTPTGEVIEKENPKRHTHRDIFEANGGDAFGSGLEVSLVSVGEAETILSLSMRLNSKVPGTGAAHATTVIAGSNHH
jgi:hypothetical protein